MVTEQDVQDAKDGKLKLTAKDFFVHGTPDAEYHADRTHMNQSTIKDGLDDEGQLDLASLFWRMHNPRPDSEPFRVGRLFHMAMLEPDKYGQRVKVAPKVDGRTKVGKEAMAAFRNGLGKEDLEASADEHSMFEAMRRSCLGNTVVQKIIGREGANELCLYGTLEDVLCRGRCDRVVWGGGANVIVDFKSTGKRIVKGRLGYTWADFGYDIQSAFYVDLAQAVTGEAWDYVVVMVEKKAERPKCLATQVDEVTLDCGRALYRKVLRGLVKARETGNWPKPKDQLWSVGVPKYRLEQSGVLDEGGAA